MLSDFERSSACVLKFVCVKSGGVFRYVPMTNQRSAKNFRASAFPIPFPTPVIKTVCMYLLYPTKEKTGLPTKGSPAVSRFSEYGLFSRHAEEFLRNRVRRNEVQRKRK